MSRQNKDDYIGTSAVERRLIELIRESEYPEKAMAVAVEVLTDFLNQQQQDHGDVDSP